MPTNGKLPMGNFSATLQALSTRDKRIVKLVLMTENAFIRMMWQTVSGLLPSYKKTYGVAETIDEAENMVKARLAEFNRSKV
jgi:prefoldin subunit 5